MPRMMNPGQRKRGLAKIQRTRTASAVRQLYPMTRPKTVNDPDQDPDLGAGGAEASPYSATLSSGVIPVTTHTDYPHSLSSKPTTRWIGDQW